MKMLWVISAVCVLAASVCAEAKQPPIEPVREFVDASNGVHWVLARDAAHPGGPGRLVADSSPHVQRQVVIRAGDRVLVEEHTDRVELRLEAIALSPAATGETFAVRLRIGGKPVRVRARSAGHVELFGEGDG